jgi:hypothetical protein
MAAQSLRQGLLMAGNCDNLAPQASYVSTTTGRANTAFWPFLIKASGKVSRERGRASRPRPSRGAWPAAFGGKTQLNQILPLLARDDRRAGTPRRPDPQNRRSGRPGQPACSNLVGRAGPVLATRPGKGDFALGIDRGNSGHR